MLSETYLVEHEENPGETMLARAGLRSTLKPIHRLKMHLTTLAAAVFLAVYAQLVCPFISTLEFSSLMLNLLGLGALQILVREGLFFSFPSPKGSVSLSRHGYFLCIATWIVTGFAALALHYFLYADFPMGSHVKLMSGYWALGAGILAQWEYVDIEEACRSKNFSGSGPRQHWEGLAHRILEGYAIFTTVPAIAMMLIILRYVYEGKQGVAIGPEVVSEVGFLGGFFVVASLLVALRFGKALKKDTEQIINGIAMVGEGSFEVSLDTSRADEFGEVALGINSMAEGLLQRERIREAFGHFVAPEVAADFLDKYTSGGKSMLGGERKQLTILLSDLRDFTPLSESLEPEALTELLNEYFSEMVLAVRAHGGVVDKFMGDAIMVIFGLLPSDGKSHEQQAVEAGIEMLQRVDAFNAQRLERDPAARQLRSGIGVHSGEVVAGYIGSKDRLEFTVIGQNVNLAARIEGQTKPPAPPLLFSKEIADRIDGELDVKEVMTTSLKGVTGPVKLFSVRSLLDPEPG
jgi:adenylate cyclase